MAKRHQDASEEDGAAHAQDSIRNPASYDCGDIYQRPVGRINGRSRVISFNKGLEDYIDHVERKQRPHPVEAEPLP